MERELQQRGVLNRLRFDALDPVDVEEVVLVVVGDVPFHLRRAHPPVRLRHVDHRQVKIGKDVRPHAAHRKCGGQGDGDHRDEDRDRAPERGTNQPHGLSTLLPDCTRLHERRQVAMGDRFRQQRPPHVDARDLNPDTRPAPAGSARPRPRRCWPGQPHSARAPGPRSVARPPIASACSRRRREPRPPWPPRPAAGW